MNFEEQNGLILLDKSQGMTSFSCDGLIKKLLHTKKVGHLGTLDPFATGLLPLCVGKGLRYVRFADGFDKAYRCTAVFGKKTDTMDIEGEVIGGRLPNSEELVELQNSDFESIRAAFDEISKITSQVPPMFSAKKINGKKAYELAREGKEVELKPVPVKIRKLSVISIDIIENMIEVIFEVSCSKGTYIRSLCDSVGDMTGFGAYAKTLRRIASGPFLEADSYTFETIEKMANEGDYSFIRDASSIIVEMPSIELNNKEAADIKLGRKISAERFSSDMDDGLHRAMYEGKVIAVVYKADEKGRSIIRIERMLA